MARTLEFSPELDRQVKLAAVACGVSGQQFIRAAVQAAVMTVAENDCTLVTALRNGAKAPVKCLTITAC